MITVPLYKKKGKNSASIQTKKKLLNDFNLNSIIYYENQYKNRRSIKEI
jgi:hypothetical protein